MLVNHRFIPTTFRLNPWKGVKGTAQNIFAPARVKLDMERILSYVYGQIADTKYGVLKKDLFTLVNIYNPDTKHSVGYLSAPPIEVVRPMSGLTLTFCLTPKPIKTPYAEPFVNRIIDFTHFWGKDITKLTDYLTINIPKDFLNKIESSHQYRDDLMYLYNVIGVCTKNWVQNQVSLTSTFRTSVPIGLLNTKFHDRTLIDTFKNVAQDHWQYVSAMWEDSSNLLSTRHFSNKFPLYFSLYLYDRFNDNLGRDAKQFIYGTGTGTLHEFISSGVRKLNQLIRSKAGSATIDADTYAATHLLLNLTFNEGGLGGADNERELWQFINQLRSRIESDDQLLPDVINHFSNIQHIARSLIDQNTEEPLTVFLEDIL